MLENDNNSGEQLTVAGPAGCLLAEDYLWQNYRLRRNVLSGKVEYRVIDEEDDKFRPLTDQAKNSIILQSRRDGFVDKEDISADLKLLFDSGDVPDYDPACEWLNSLTWDGKERLVDFFKRIPGIKAEEIHWLTIWIRGFVAQILNMNKEHGNECVPTLIGAQGAGKSTFFVRMLPPHLREYYMDDFRLNNNFDKDSALTSNLLVNIDELDSYTAPQQAKIKHALSKVKVNSRRAYGRTQDNRPRRASFTATTNNPHPLCDPTGSRRFICINIPKGTYIDNITPVEHNQIFAQIVYELQHDERYWYTNDEVNSIQVHNSQYMAISSFDQMVEYCVRPLEEGEESLISPTEIAEHIKEKFPASSTSKISTVKIGRVMHSLGYTLHRNRHAQLYEAAFREAS